MADFFAFLKDILLVSGTFLPPWFQIVLISVFGLLIIIGIIKLIAFILDAIPFF